MHQTLGDQFLLACKQNYFDRVTPSNILSRPKEGYKRVESIAKEYFKRGEYSEFAGFFQESQYFIPIWAAHMLLQYGTPDRDLKIASLNVIKNYTDNPLAPEVAQEEKDWIELNRERFKEYF
jgi:hypothetical protein